MVNFRNNGPKMDNEQLAFHITKEIERHEESLSKIQECLVALKVDIATLKVKASMWGAASGLFSSLIMIGMAVAMYLLKKG